MIRTTAAAVLLAVLVSAARADRAAGPTVADDLPAVDIRLQDGYAAAHPRLLFGPADRQAIRQAAEAHEELRARILWQAAAMGKYVPAPDDIRDGKQYWRAEYMLSGALAWLVTGEAAHRDSTIRWMIAHCAEDTWGTGYGANVDLFAAWYLYYVSLAYDILYDQLDDAQRKAILAGLISHAEAIYQSKLPPQDYRFDQNHTYIPVTALATASLALSGETPLADKWLRLAAALMNRSRYVLGTDGYYYEGTGYWTYALHWHVRYADLAARAFGGTWHDLPALAENWRFALHMSLPGWPFRWDVGDGGSYGGDRAAHAKVAWNHMLYAVAAANRDGAARAVADRIVATGRDADDPGMQLLWTMRADGVEPADLADLPPYHHFADHDVVAWRSGWDDDATCYLFRCGPPEGHAAADKLRRMKDWTMNSGHVHPDIGAFWIFAGGRYLAVDSGYTARKFTDDHNTLLIDGAGQGVDGNYWVYRGWPYARFDAARIVQTHLADDVGYVCGDFGAVYTPADKPLTLKLRRHLAMADRFLLVVDDMNDTAPHGLTWLLHTTTDAPITADGMTFASTAGPARLVTYVLSPEKVIADIGPTEVLGGTAPGPGTLETRGHQLAIRTLEAAPRQRLVVLLLPLADGRPAPAGVRLEAATDSQVAVTIAWADRPAETVTLDLDEATDASRRVTIRESR
ncbi:MAG: DUF4962 domain-containing protein [Planctomycetes bacterium]|nr:DUF4962 domain-containing protein [Planctomycetota bacterium]